MMFRFAPASLLLLLACETDKVAEETGSPADPCAAAEVCNGLDDDCDGLADEADPDLDVSTRSFWYEDLDGDGYGPGRTAVEACSSPYALGVLEGGDCQADDPAIHPEAEEICDGVDNDCDGTVDAGAEDGVVLYEDEDMDGFGVDGTETFGCAGAWGFAELAGDCDDDEPLRFPGAPEYCYDGVDQDCEGDGDGGCPTEVCGDIREDTVWPASEDGYYVSCEIDVAATLTVEPGTTLWFAPGAGLEVGEFGTGALAIDAADAPVIFTSAVGRLDPSQTPAPGDWRGVVLSAGMDGTTIRGLQVWYAGGAGEDEDDLASAAIEVEGGEFALDARTEIGLDRVGVYASGTVGVRANYGAALRLSDSEIADNLSYGVYIEAEALPPRVTGSSLHDNGDYVMSMAAFQATELDDSNTIEEVDGDSDLIELRGGVISESIRVVSAGRPYAVTEDIEVWGVESPVLTLSDGVEMKIANEHGIQIGKGVLAGDLVVEGDELGVTLRELTGSGWDGLRMEQLGGESVLRGLTLLDAGASGSGALYVGDPEIILEIVTLEIEDCVIDGAVTNGISLGCGVLLSVHGTTISNSGDYALRTTCAGYGNDTLAPSSEGGSFADNVLSGNTYTLSLTADSVGELDASSTFSGNDIDQIELVTDDVTRSATWQALDADYYAASSGISVGGEDSPTLTLEEGVTIKLSDGSLLVGDDAPGALVVEGSADAPVTLTSRMPTTLPGDWGGLVFERDCEDSSLSGLQVSYAEVGLTIACDADIEVSDSTFLSSRDADLSCVDDDAVLWSDITYASNDGCSVD